MSTISSAQIEHLLSTVPEYFYDLGIVRKIGGQDVTLNEKGKLREYIFEYFNIHE